MGDYYRGGRGGGGYSRKRRYRDDDEYDRRQRYEETPFDKVRKDTLTIAETPLVRTEDAIKNIANGVCDNFEDEELRNGFQDLIQALIVEQPFKIPFLASVVMYINAKKPEIAKVLIDETVSLAKSHLAAGDLRKFKLELRFLGCINSILEDTGILPILEALIERARILQESGEEELPIELTRIALITMPYVMAGPEPIDKDVILPVLEKCYPIVNKDFKISKYLTPFKDLEQFEIGTPVVKLLLQQLTAEAERDWPVHCLPKPWEHFTEEWKEVENISKHGIPGIEVPEEFPNVEREKYIPQLFFSVYFAQAAEVETIPSPADIACSIFRDNIQDTVDILNFNRLAVARFLIDIDCYFSPNAFIKRATPFDRVKEMAGDRSTWKGEDVVVDAVFAQLFNLPKPEHKPVYYHSVLTEVCKLAPAAIAPSLGRAIRALYNHLEYLDAEFISRFVDWFSHHLSNFAFSWKWAEWIPNLSLPDVHPQKAFILETIEKEIRLSFTSRIKSTLPEEYQELISEDKQKDTPDFKFDDESNPLSEQGKTVLRLLKERKPAEEMDEYLATVIEKAKELGMEDPESVARDMYVTCICHIGSKSLSHVLSCIERCKLKLMALGSESPSARRQIIRSVLSYWAAHPGVGANVVDKLLNYSILTPASVVEYVLLDAGDAALSKSHCWEMVSTTINKVNNRVKQIRSMAPADPAALPDETRSAYEMTLENARLEQRHLAELVLAQLDRIAEGEGDEWVRWWGRNWGRAFRRRFLLEGVVQGEEKMEVDGDM